MQFVTSTSNCNAAWCLYKEREWTDRKGEKQMWGVFWTCPTCQLLVSQIVDTTSLVFKKCPPRTFWWSTPVINVALKVTYLAYLIYLHLSSWLLSCDFLLLLNKHCGSGVTTSDTCLVTPEPKKTCSDTPNNRYCLCQWKSRCQKLKNLIMCRKKLTRVHLWLMLLNSTSSYRS